MLFVYKYIKNVLGTFKCVYLNFSLTFWVLLGVCTGHTRKCPQNVNEDFMERLEGVVATSHWNVPKKNILPTKL